MIWIDSLVKAVASLPALLIAELYSVLTGDKSITRIIVSLIYFDFYIFYNPQSQYKSSVMKSIAVSSNSAAPEDT